ncbi:hypothetical protein NDN08_006304 [Rhodosorus marinus]|uniref:ATP synthase subunit d, mitochondrial n=1 Tax=Rhodosorus marinus TaxID=101924 RepID=A0AAV8UNU7_9RHOD|nr:hypothetical protein NDN08_006304 [Rhodosorus marinus]
MLRTRVLYKQLHGWFLEGVPVYHQRLPGYEYDDEAREKLKTTYQATLTDLEKLLPKASVYRQNVEKITKFRLGLVESALGDDEIVKKIQDGSLEEVLHHAEEEQKLVKDFATAKAWDGDSSKVKIQLID